MTDCWNISNVIAGAREPVMLKAKPNLTVVVPCSSQKLDRAALAMDLYTGPYHKACMAYARSIVPASNILILSAKYGFVGLWETIEPYELRMDQRGSACSARIYAQAVELGIVGRPALALGGLAYTERVARALPRTTVVQELLAPGKRGIGYQLQWLKANRGQIPAIIGR